MEDQTKNVMVDLQKVTTVTLLYIYLKILFDVQFTAHSFIIKSVSVTKIGVRAVSLVADLDMCTYLRYLQLGYS